MRQTPLTLCGITAMAQQIKRKKILVLDDEIGIRELLAEILTDEGYAVVCAANAEDAWKARMEEDLSLVLLDIWMPGLDGLTLLKQWNDSGLGDVPVLIMSGHATIDMAVEAMKLGAREVLEKPIATSRLLSAVENTLHRQLASRASPLIRHENFGKTPAMRQLKKQMLDASAESLPVLFVGAAESGMFFFAQFLAPPNKPLVAVESGVQLEVDMQKLLRKADGGLIIIRHLDLLSPAQQSGLLGLVREAARINTRVAACSAHPPEALAEKQNYNRKLTEIFSRRIISVPALAQCADDLPEIAALVAKSLTAQTDMSGKHLTPMAINLLCQHDYENGFAELMSAVRSAFMLSGGDKVDADIVGSVLERFLRNAPPRGATADIYAMPLREAREAFEREYFRNILQLTR
ncbi:MAG: sigma-54-dependent transcriptional regulator, partial [Gammaproteobacteria bacterium]